MIKNRPFLIRGAPDAPPGAPKASWTAYTAADCTLPPGTLVTTLRFPLLSRPRVPASRTRGLPPSLGSNRTRRNSVRYVGLKAFGKSLRRVVICFFGSLRSSEWKSSETFAMEDLVSGSIRKSLIFEGFRRYAGKIFCVELLICSWFL